MLTYPYVPAYKSGPFGEKEANAPVLALAARTDYLKRKLEQLEGGNLILRDVPLDMELPPSIGDVVYRDPVTKTAKPAIALVDEFKNNHTHATAGTFASGVLIDIEGSSGVILVAGKMPTDILASNMIEPGEQFRPGPYYLSNRTPGKVTAHPGGAVVFIGTLAADFSVVNCNYNDLQQAHRHVGFTLQSAVAGAATILPGSGRVLLSGFAPTAGSSDVKLVVTGGSAGIDCDYTFTLTGTGLIGSTRLHWSTSDHSDDGYTASEDPGYGVNTGVLVTALSHPIPIGSKGIVVYLEKNVNYFDVDVAETDVVYVGSHPSWVISVPHDTLGWVQNSSTAQLTFSSTTAADPQYRCRVFGARDDASLPAALRTAETLSITVTPTANGNLVLGGCAVTVSLQANGYSQAYNLTDVVFNTAVVIVPGLFLCLSPTREDGSNTINSDLLTDHSWQGSLVDDGRGLSFRYSLDMDPALSAAYPTGSFDSGVLVMNGVIMDHLNQFSAGAGTWYAGRAGIYWRPYDYESCPFATDEVTSGRNVAIYTTIMTAASGIVTSLRPVDGSIVTLRDRRSLRRATSGDLDIDIDLQLGQRDVDEEGCLVVKSARGSNFFRGAVVELIEEGPGIRIDNLTPRYPGQGRVRISTRAATILSGPMDVTLRGARFDLTPVHEFNYIRLLPRTGVSSSAFTCQLTVPTSASPVPYTCAVLLPTFPTEPVPTDGAVYVAQLKVSYAIAKDMRDETGYAGLTGNLLTTPIVGETLVNVRFQAGHAAYDPVLVHNDTSMSAVNSQIQAAFAAPMPFAQDGGIYEGWLLVIRVERVATTELNTGELSYSGSIGVINPTWKLMAK